MDLGWNEGEWGWAVWLLASLVILLIVTTLVVGVRMALRARSQHLKDIATEGLRSSDDAPETHPAPSR